jgi:biotin synthase
MELCCGVILGMGETVEQRIEMAMELSEIEPESIPINILMPIPKTPFEGYLDKIDEENVLRTLAIFKIANPKSILRFCGGRMRLSDENQEKALKSCVEGILTGNYLTTTGKSPQDDIVTIKKLNKNLVKI